MGQGEHPLLFSRGLYCKEVHWITGKAPATSFKCTTKTRYRMKDHACTVEQKNERECCVMFDAPERAVTPGQSVVFYQGEYCLGGGVIDTIL